MKMKILKGWKSFNESLGENIKIGDKYKLNNPKGGSVTFEITSLDKESDIANVRVNLPNGEFNDIVVSISNIIEHGEKI
jgi:hypothetical protein